MPLVVMLSALDLKSKAPDLELKALRLKRMAVDLSLMIPAPRHYYRCSGHDVYVDLRGAHGGNCVVMRYVVQVVPVFPQQQVLLMRLYLPVERMQYLRVAESGVALLVW